MSSSQQFQDTESPKDTPRFAPAGDSALIIEFEPLISREVNARARALANAISGCKWPEVVAIVPSYRSLLIYYDCVSVSFLDLTEKIRSLQVPRLESMRRRRWLIPACYEGDRGPDINELAARLSLTPEKIVLLHTSVEYMVYMIGFSPGFAYLGELPAELRVPRKDAPTAEVPANSLQIGGGQTALSSMPMPSGWYIVGQTPLRMFDAQRTPPFLLDAGDLVLFEPINELRFVEMSREMAEGCFEIRWEWV